MPKPTVVHSVKLVYRAALLIAVGVFLAMRQADPQCSPGILFPVVWIVFMVEMVRRMFPIRSESVGCQKQYAYAFRTAAPAEKRPTLPHRRALAVAAIWTGVNAVIGFAYLRGAIGQGALLLFSLFFAVSDMICVLAFCPFQKWVMKNRCCITCRIYDWDYAMMFAPLAFIPSAYTWSLFGMGLAVLAKWEIAVFRHPERFSEVTNASLSCKNCTEKLCRHKKL